MLRMTAHDAYNEAMRQEDGFFSTLYDAIQDKILEATKNKQLQMITPISASLDELFEALNALENDGFITTVRIMKYDEKQLPYVETSVSVSWSKEIRD